jgi:hypothetical protein
MNLWGPKFLSETKRERERERERERRERQKLDWDPFGF